MKYLPRASAFGKLEALVEGARLAALAQIARREEARIARAHEGRPDAAHHLRHGRRPAPGFGRDPEPQHTGTEVRIAAVGPQSARINGVIDETEINGILTSFRQRGRGWGPRRGGAGRAPPRRRCRQAVARGARAGTTAASAAWSRSFWSA